MRLFGRRERAADEALPFLTEDEAQRVRALVRTAFAEQGLDVTVYADHVRDAQGTEYGLWNVATSCHHDKPAAWPGLVARHVRALRAAVGAPHPLGTMAADEAMALTYARVLAVDSLPDLSRVPHRPFAPGLVETLALDQPETVTPYFHEHLDRLGGWDAAHAAGLRNLAAGPRGEPVRLDAGGGHFRALIDDSVFTASLALLMPGLAGEQPAADGWLLALPSRHHVLWHVVTDISVVPSLEGMSRFARRAYAESAGPLSPHVFWWDGAEYQQLTSDDGSGSVVVRVEGEFLAMLERLAAR